ncbi:NRDE family protein [Acanthopleuribacter pedis]|uniref:NRDE family protein n=1 Tax=Acanthopleuribacter pedis TaxID=442870 RepID=A0A8J7U6V0_9BACT|nr:NRDE family protein [Acanthopleuribacter pedis]MBO1321808.1 NRDE family protein [Acanthopleuribacter pedis]
MCTLLIAYQVHDAVPLVIAANRDEFYKRPTQRLAFWDDHPDLLAGRDLEQGGTWLGVSRHGRFAALTNFRDPAAVLEQAPSRGLLVRDYLAHHQSHDAFVQRLCAEGARYSGFNLIFGRLDALFYFSNQQAGGVEPLTPGYHGLSNHLLNAPWPKLRKGMDGLRRWQPGQQGQVLFDLLADSETFPDALLPRTGVPMAWERLLSSLYIESPVYGSRVGSLLTWEKNGRLTLEERSYGNGDGPHEPRRFELAVSLANM